MPTYAYACRDCGHQFETVQSFTDDSLTVCPECGGSLRKVFNSVGVVFKGGGFYRTDSRASSSSSSPASSSASSSGDSGSGSSSNGGSATSGAGASSTGGSSATASSTASA
ncbi:putative FmdB family regulatory protein [Knoellia remsis]|uniref:Putative FmdB family regulatory protein n=1 Tax=Knoellia remsis TaxID=407159 RepID=A0A2T0U6J7_9MICO|nr:FmdB family zinc ribbon protein [Knoellia remsis]PRY53488.1 putative FmdB family regulatory protein [Knoellia remsis]